MTNGTTSPPPLEEPKRLGLASSEWTMICRYLAVVSLIGLYWLFGPADSVPKPPPDLGSLPKLDGTMAVIERRLVMKPFRPLAGQQAVTFFIRYGDARSFDIVHLRAHAALAIPTRIYYARSGSRLFALWKEDAPENSQPAPRKTPGPGQKAAAQGGS